MAIDFEAEGRTVNTPPTAIAARNLLIEQWIIETCAKCGFPELAGVLSYEISDAPFFRDHGGYATTVWGDHGRVARGLLQFSRIYWTLPRQLNAYRRNLVIHETCHIVANHIAGRDVQHQGPVAADDEHVRAAFLDQRFHALIDRSCCVTNERR